MRMAVLEQPPWFGPDPALDGVLPLESVAPPPLTAKAFGSTVGVGADSRAQVATKEATPKDP